eukprot:TRINITY_DN50220_c0_g1_i2.p1 TRINITY_DN50220_c0_g1~~TRINITY_DN50220_c0_g1_i2.p1  ORF type:complete len:565 (+),score=172.47 TRINITY_DN50220_c0_g1_i2:177-1871(+)
MASKDAAKQGPPGSGPSTELEGIGATGTSGLSNCEKFRWSLSFAAVWVSAAGTAGIRNVYVITFGGPATALGVLFVVLSLMLPVFMAIAGKLLKNELLPQMFPVERFGHYSGWMMLAAVVLALAVLGMFIPPSFDDVALCAWSGITFSMAYWAQAMLVVAGLASEVEIFPYRPERIQIVMFITVSVLIGASTTIVCVLIVMANSAFGLRLLCGLIAACIALITVGFSIKPQQLAQQPRGNTASLTFFEDIRDVFKNDAARWITAATTLESSVFSINIFFVLYFYTYNLEMTSADATFWYGATLAAVIVSSAVFSAIATKVFEGHDSLDLQRTSVICTMMQAAVWPAFMAWAESPGWVVFCWTLTIALGIPSNFFQSVAKAWVVDEDVHTTEMRREGVFQAAIGCVTWLAGSALPPLLLVGLGALGFDARDCSGFDSDSDQQKACETASREDQPSVVERYIYWVQIVPAVVLLLGSAYCFHRFPINGARLEKIHENQASSFKKIPKPKDPKVMADKEQEPEPEVVHKEKEPEVEQEVTQVAMHIDGEQEPSANQDQDAADAPAVC